MLLFVWFYCISIVQSITWYKIFNSLLDNILKNSALNTSSANQYRYFCRGGRSQFHSSLLHLAQLACEIGEKLDIWKESHQPSVRKWILKGEKNQTHCYKSEENREKNINRKATPNPSSWKLPFCLWSWWPCQVCMWITADTGASLSLISSIHFDLLFTFQ